MQITPANLLARIMKLENMTGPNNNGEILHKLNFNGNIIAQSGTVNAYSMRQDGLWVDIEGVCQTNPTPGTSIIASGTSIFTLPVGYRPIVATAGITCSCFPTTGGGEGYILINTAGVGTYSGPASAATAIIFAGAIPIGTPV